jgi:transcription-repair coupling factor (superfamily II helicase)
MTSVYGAFEGQDARYLISSARELAQTQKMLMHVALDDVRMAVLEDTIKFFAPEIEIIKFPSWDCLPYDRVSPNADIVQERLKSLMILHGWQQDKLYKPRIFLTTINAFGQKLLPQTELMAGQMILTVGASFHRENFISYLLQNGYERTDTVREIGQFSVRGDIFDFYPVGSDTPVRIDLFGNDIEKIRAFDPITQISDKKLPSVTMGGASEYFFTESHIERFRSQYRSLFGVQLSNDPLYQAVTEGRRFAGLEHWSPLFFDSMANLWDYVDGYASISIDAACIQSSEERWTQIKDFYEARMSLDQSLHARKSQKKSQDVSLSGSVYHPLPPEYLYHKPEDIMAVLSAQNALQYYASLSPHEDDDVHIKRGRDFSDIRAQPQLNLFREVGAYLKSQTGTSRMVLLACYSAGSRDRLIHMLNENQQHFFKVCNDFDDARRIGAGYVGAVILPLERGFVADDLMIVTEQDILGDRLSRPQRRKKRGDHFLKEASALSVGDIIVHVDHGVGKFDGLETLKVGGLLHDCLRLIYAGGDKLFLPVENIDLLSRYGGENDNVDLDRLGGVNWQARKARVKKDLMKIADHLMKIAAERATKSGVVLEPLSGAYDEFVAKFPYQETDDQLRAIEDTLSDLASGKPMDRLVCGDVGFGKTEIAMRAAYVAASLGMQVAVIAPTTLLTRQHYLNFTERFKGLGLRTAHLSRLVNAKDLKLAKDCIADGSVNVAVGTHSLLSDSVKFAKLGLVIIDEEQKFGVKQKEKLKELKSDVHVLTLTATPIPRTLQMALTGVRDMSIIATPPVDRLAIRTFVMPYDPLVIRDAILREHYRGGQSFYVCPRIKDLEQIAEQLTELVPEVKFIMAHGQMTPTELEDRMNAFYDGQAGILLATNIIESGLDIPSANTIIVHRADLFGLSQLYQIRGRVGRSKVRAYAYLTHSPDHILNKDAQKRLEVFETLDSLGAGFQLASHDLDIRGSGNLVGEEQSGHVREVGVELYQQMLEDAVMAVKAGGTSRSDDSEWSPVINLGISVLIPETYIADLTLRMNLYRRLSDINNDEELNAFGAELVDRFGALPPEVENLLGVMAIKSLAKSLGISQLDMGPNGGVISFRHNAPPKPEKLLGWLQKNFNRLKIRPDQKITILSGKANPQDGLSYVKNILTELFGHLQ